MFVLRQDKDCVELQGQVLHSPSKYAFLLGEYGQDTILIRDDGTFCFKKRMDMPCAATFMIPKSPFVLSSMVGKWPVDMLEAGYERCDDFGCHRGFRERKYIP